MSDRSPSEHRPIYTTRRDGHQCSWQLGGTFIPGTRETFGGNSTIEYGPIAASFYPAPNGILQYILENSRVGTPPRTDGVVGPGMTVTVRFVRDDEEVTFLLASREESGSPIDVYSPKSPLGAAIMGKKVGEKATYSLPNGRASTVEILEAVPYAGV